MVSPHPQTEPDPPRTLGELLDRLVAADPDAVALIDRGPDGEALPLSRRELAARVASLTGELSAVGPGDAVAVWLPNWSDALVWQFAVAARGAHVVGVNTRYGVADVTHVLERARPSTIVLPAAFHGLDLLDRLRAVVAGYGGPAPAVAVVPGPGRDPVTDPAGFDAGAGAWSPTIVVPERVGAVSDRPAVGGSADGAASTVAAGGAASAGAASTVAAGGAASAGAASGNAAGGSASGGAASGDAAGGAASGGAASGDAAGGAASGGAAGGAASGGAASGDTAGGAASGGAASGDAAGGAALADSASGTLVAGTVSAERTESAGRTVPADTAVSDEDPAALVVAFTTSGSTGMPKLAAHSAGAVVGHAVADAAAMGLRPGDTVLGALPLSGVFGYNAALAGLAAGAAVLLEPVFDAGAVLAAMAHHRVTHVGAGDDMMLRVAEAWRAERTALPDWRWLGIADFQGRSREIAEWARDAHGVRTTGVYGSSEAFALLSMWPDDDPEPHRWTGGGRLVGATTEVRAVDPDTRTVLDPGAEGELEFRGPTVVDAYLGEPDRPTGDADGWFASGDLGVVTEPGVFTYTCRAGDALRLRGFLVDPADIEVRLAEHPSVHTAKVVGVPDADGATRAVAFVVGEPGPAPDPESLRAWCAEALARFKVPHAVQVIDEMPTTSGTNGTKIRAATLREWAAHI